MFKKRLASFRYAFKGIFTLVKSEPNARIHLLATLCVVGAAWYWKVSSEEWCWLVLCIILVWSAEAMNTALEALTDLVSPDTNPLAGKAKDVAAAAVLILAIGAAIIGSIIFLPKLLHF